MSTDVCVDSARDTVERFYSAWQRRAWKDMFTVTAVTWQVGRRPVILLQRTGCGKRVLRSFTILGMHLVPDVDGVTPIDPELLIDYDVEVVYTLNGVDLRLVQTARLVREAAPYTPSKTGTWGVNPISISRERMA